MPEILLNGSTPQSISHGLGLYIIHDLAKSIDRVINIHDTAGNGTTISITLPEKKT